jgi:parallel beta-helix repeat protein
MKRFLINLFNGFRSTRPTTRKRAHSPRLFMEVLEDRSLPSTTGSALGMVTVSLAGDPLGAHQGVTLRDAIKMVNADTSDTATSPDKIVFALSGQGVQVIQLNKALPHITRPVIIDGLSQGGPGYTGTPLVALTPAKPSMKGDGLHVTHGNVTIDGLAVYGFKGFGLDIGGANDAITDDYVGVDASGNDVANGASGIFLHGANSSTITGCTIGNNHHRGIRVDGSAHVTIGGTAPGAGNTITTNGIGDPDYAGIVVKGGSWDVTIQGNTITGDGRGIRIAGKAGTTLPTGATYSIVIDSNKITGSKTQGILIDNHFGGPAKNVQVSNDDIENSAGYGVKVDHASNIGFTGDTIKGSGKDGILIAKGVTTVTFTSNDIENNSGYGVEIKSRSVASPDSSNTIQNNTKGNVKRT